MTPCLKQSQRTSGKQKSWQLFCESRDTTSTCSCGLNKSMSQQCLLQMFLSRVGDSNKHTCLCQLLELWKGKGWAPSNARYSCTACMQCSYREHDPQLGHCTLSWSCGHRWTESILREGQILFPSHSNMGKRPSATMENKEVSTQETHPTLPTATHGKSLGSHR